MCLGSYAFALLGDVDNPTVREVEHRRYCGKHEVGMPLHVVAVGDCRVAEQAETLVCLREHLLNDIVSVLLEHRLVSNLLALVLESITGRTENNDVVIPALNLDNLAVELEVALLLVNNLDA